MNFEPSTEFSEENNGPQAIIVTVRVFDVTDAGLVPTNQMKRLQTFKKNKEEAGEKFNEIVQQIGSDF